MSGSRRAPDLETSFRSWMRAYPRRYRLEREDEIVGVLLDCAPPEQRRATASDAAHIVWSGLRYRVEQGRVPSPRNRWSDGFAALAALVIAVEVARVLGVALFTASSALLTPVDVPPQPASTVVVAPLGLALVASSLVILAAILLLTRRPRGAGICIAAAPLVGMAGELATWSGSTIADGVAVADAELPWMSVTGQLTGTLLSLVAGFTLIIGRDRRRGIEAWGLRNLILTTGAVAVATCGWCWIVSEVIAPGVGISLWSSVVYLLVQVGPLLVAVAAMWPHLRRHIDRAGRRLVLAAVVVFVVGPFALTYAVANPLSAYGAKPLIAFDLLVIIVAITTTRILMTRKPVRRSAVDTRSATPLP